MDLIGPTFILILTGVIFLTLVIFVVSRTKEIKIPVRAFKIARPVKDVPPTGEASFEWYARRSILLCNEFGITAVQQMERIQDMYLNRDNYPMVREAIANATSIEALKEIPKETVESYEDIKIITFRDQDENLYAATIYDSWELWQDPQVADIFPLLLQTV